MANIKQTTNMLQIKGTLAGIHPFIWREFLISEKSTLLDLHDLIQDAFGWEDQHLHEFIIRGELFGDPQDDEDGMFGILDETDYELRMLGLREGSRFSYRYDYGDNWVHNLRVIRVLPMPRGIKLPQCLQGKRACPPEDVGGSEGYKEFLAVLQDPTHVDHQSCLEWIGGSFDPQACDLQAINDRIRIRQGYPWPTNPLASLTPEDSLFQDFLNPLRWKVLETADYEAAAAHLPLRRDVDTFLSYLEQHKVIGTAALGNLPWPVIVDFSTQMVEPAALQKDFGDFVFTYHSEEEVFPIRLIHCLAYALGLVSGGYGQRWKVSPLGAAYQGLPAVSQVQLLLITWWNFVNWNVVYRHPILPNEFSLDLREKSLPLLLTLPIHRPQSFQSFNDRLVQSLAWENKIPDPSRLDWLLSDTVHRMVLEPLQLFGILELELDPAHLPVLRRVTSLEKTAFGHALLSTILPRSSP